MRWDESFKMENESGNVSQTSIKSIRFKTNHSNELTNKIEINQPYLQATDTEADHSLRQVIDVDANTLFRRATNFEARATYSEAFDSYLRLIYPEAEQGYIRVTDLVSTRSYERANLQAVTRSETSFFLECPTWLEKKHHQYLQKTVLTLSNQCLHLMIKMFILCIAIGQCKTADPSVYDNLYTHVLNGYNPNTLPILNYGEGLNISITIFTVSLNEYDQISGEISLTMLFMLSWNEKRIYWNAAHYYNISSIQIPIKKVWIPQIFVREVSSIIKPLGPLEMSITIQDTGYVAWTFGEILKITCSPDVTYFPFDRQQCVISFTLANNGNSEVRLYPVKEYLDTVYLSTNSQWEILQSPITSDGQTLTLSLKLERRTTFYVVYIIIPVILLGLVNNLVLVLPSTSGERMSVAITTLLSFIVYMDIVNSNVPESSAPVPYIYNYLLLLMLYSSIILVFCIVSMRIRDKETKVPRVLERITHYARLRGCKIRKSTVSQATSPKRTISNVTELSIDNHLNELHESEKEEDKTPGYGDPVTWKTVSETFDIYCTICLLLIYSIVTFETFAKLKANEGL